MDTEIPVNYVAQLSGRKNLKSLDSYNTASDEHQRKMSLVLSRGKKNSPISSNVAPVNPAVKAWELEPFKQQEKKKSFFRRGARLFLPFHWFQYQKHRGMHV